MANILLDGVTSTGVGPALKVSNHSPSQHTVQVLMGGTVVATAVTVDLEGSLDGATWFTLGQRILSAPEITAAAAMFHVVNKPVNFVRANLVTLTGGTAPTVTVLYVSERKASG